MKRAQTATDGKLDGKPREGDMETGSYRLESGASGWQISKRRVTGARSKEPGVENWSAFRFHATLERAALDLLDILIHDKADTTDTTALIDAVHEAQAETKRVLVECLTK